MKDGYIGLMVGDSSALLVGLLAILKSGNCLVPINPGFPDDRVNLIVADCQVSALLTDKDNYAKGRRIVNNNKCLQHLICIDEIDFAGEIQKTCGKSETWHDETRPQQPCYVIFTSGSTGKPKGVQITHSNLIPLLLWFHDYFKLGEHTRVLQNLSYTFDFGIFELITTLLAGGSLYFFDKKALSDLNDYVDFIHQHRINTIHTTPSFFSNILALRRSISPLKLLHFGGERLTGKMVGEVSRLVGKNSYIYNGYGPTETTINSSICCVHEAGELEKEVSDNIPIGKPTANNIIYILDTYGNLQPVGVVGELYIAGSGVAGGYLNRPELTKEKFTPGTSTYHLTNASTHQILYRTGDLGRWLPDGNIEFLGRIDHQVKVRGFRIELGEIENKLHTHEMVKEAVVIDREMKEGDSYLCAYIVPEREFEIIALHDYLSQSLPDYMIPSYFVEIEKIPLDPNGKVNRRALPLPEPVETVYEYTAPRDEIEEKITAIWAQALGLEKEKIGIDDNFFHLGGHSLKGTVILSRVHKEFDLKVVLSDLFKIPTIRGLSTFIKKGAADKYLSIKPVEKKDYFLLSSAQMRLYVLDQMEFESIGYNIPVVYQLKEEPDSKRLENAFRQLIDRHESYRTSFHMVDQEPVQRIKNPGSLEFNIEYYSTGPVRDADVRPQQEIIRRFVRPFDLAEAPLLRVGLIRIMGSTTPAILLVDMHHIISDGISLEIFQKELVELYDLRDLTSLRIQYKDYAEWQDRECSGEKVIAREEYWLQEFSGEIPVLNLPLDYPRPAVQSFAGNTIHFELGLEDVDSLKELAGSERVTLFMVLFAVFNILLAKLSGQEDIVVGIPTEGRSHPDLENIMGMFVNTLALRNYPTGEKRFDHFLQEIKERTLNAFENQEYQFEDLVESLTLTRDASRNPLFDVMFAMHTMALYDVETTGLKIISRRFESRISKFDLSLSVAEAEDTLFFSMEYCTGLFKDETIKRFIGYFKEIISSVLINKEIRLDEIKVFHHLYDKKLANPEIDFIF